MKYARLPYYRAKSCRTTGELIKECRVFNGSSLLYPYALTLFPINTWRPEHDDVIKWKSPVNSPLKGQWRGALMFSLYAWMKGWVNNGEAGDLRRYRAHFDVTVMTKWTQFCRRRDHQISILLALFAENCQQWRNCVRIITSSCYQVFFIRSVCDKRLTTHWVISEAGDMLHQCINKAFGVIWVKPPKLGNAYMCLWNG